jgi:myo-inositol catabolism protein IolC
LIVGWSWERRSDTGRHPVEPGVVLLATIAVGGSPQLAMSTPNDCWLPSPDEPLFVLDLEHDASFARDVFRVRGTPSDADLVDMRLAKSLIYEGLRHVAGSVPFGREGVLVDEDLGAEVIRAAQSDGVVVLMPIERSGTAVSEMESRDRFNQHIEAVDPDFFTSIVHYNPRHDDGTRQAQTSRLAAVSEWAQDTHRRLVIGLLVPPPSEPSLAAQVIVQLQTGGVHPTIWKLQGFESPSAADEVLAAVAADVQYPATCIMSDRGTPIGRIEHRLAVAANRQFVGFAIGGTIWEAPLRRFLAGTLSNEGVIDAVAENYGTFVEAFVRGSGGLETPRR